MVPRTPIPQLTRRRPINPARSLFARLVHCSLLATLLFYSAPAAAQNVPLDSVPPIDPATILQDTVVTLREIQRRPRSTLFWSIIPGGGQAYNKKFWKVPLVYGGLLGMVAYADFNQTQYRRFRDAIFDRCLGEGNVIIIPNNECLVEEGEFPIAQVPTNALISARDNADRARQTAYIGIFIVYALQAVEAYTDSHLQEFDISDDISLRFGPVAQPEYTAGYGLTVPLGANLSHRREVALARQLAAGR